MPTGASIPLALPSSPGLVLTLLAWKAHLDLLPLFIQDSAHVTKEVLTDCSRQAQNPFLSVI